MTVSGRQVSWWRLLLCDGPPIAGTWPTASRLIGHLFLWLLLLGPSLPLLATCSGWQQPPAQATFFQAHRSAAVNESTTYGRSALEALFQQQQQQQQSTLENNTRSSKRQQESPITTTATLSETWPPTRNHSRLTEARTASKRRHRRHVALPGTVQLQEFKRKGGSSSHQSQQTGSPLSVAQNRDGGGQNQKATITANSNKRQVIYAMLKGQVVIPCNLQPPEQDDSVSLILWYKDKSMVPIYSVDARSTPIQEARHKPGPWLEGRATLKIIGQPTSQGAAKVRRKRRADATIRHHHQARHQDEATDNAEAEVKRAEPVNEVYEEGDVEDMDVDEDYGDEYSKELRVRDAKWAARLRPTYSLGRERRRSSKWLDDDDTNGQPSSSGWHRIAVRGGPSESLARPLALTASSAGGNQQLVAHLHVDSLSSEDNGLYSCRVDFRKARSKTQESLLKIIVPADKPIVRDLTANADGQHLKPPGARPLLAIGDPSVQVVGPHNEGARLVLQCETQGGYPEPMLTWWRNGRLLDDSYELVSATDGLVVSRHTGGAQSSNGQAGDEPADDEQLLTADVFRSRAKLVGGYTNEFLDPTISSSSATAQDLDESPGGGVGAIDMEAASDEQPSSSSSSDSDGASGGGAKELLAGANNKPVTQNRLIRNRLELRALTRQDLIANYSCQAWNTRLSEPPATSIMIDMNLRPIKVQIDNERLPVLADRPLEIVCRAFGSRPAALITWWRGSSRLVPANEINPPAGHHHQHHPQQLRPLGADPSSQPPSPMQATANSVQIQESISADGNVTSSSLSLVPRIEDGGQIISCRAENPHLQHSLSTSNSIEDSWKLEVHYLPLVRLALGEKLHHQGLIQEGHDVYFECTVKALPNAQEIRWWFDGRELETNVSSGVIISNQSLVLQRVNRHQRGRYTCSAINSMGESHSNSVHLRVQYAPFCRDHSSYASSRQEDNNNRLMNENDTEGPFSAISQQRFKTHYGAARLESVKVYCHIDADPIESISYKWAFVATMGSGNSSDIGRARSVGGSAATGYGNGPQFTGQQLVFLDPSSVSILAPENPLVSVATYTPRSELDYGTLLCWGQNSLGQQVEPCAYQIVPAEKPDSLRNCRLVNASDIQLTVACEPGYDGGVDQSFQMEVYDASKHELVANISSISLEGSANSKNLYGWRDEPQQVQQQFISIDSAMGGSGNNSIPGGEVPASLVSEPIFGSRQQKQRHSSAAVNQHQNRNSSPPQATPYSSSPETLINHLDNSIETLFVTEPILRPATHYFLSIYSTNSKGSSKPVAFTASTMNLTGAEIGLASSGRDGRRSADPSHLLSDMLSLSWSPFLLICAITVVLFILFASITFAMMKYVDFSAAFPSSSYTAQTTSGSSSSSGYGHCLPKESPPGKKGKFVAGGNGDLRGHKHRLANNNSSNTDDDDADLEDADGDNNELTTGGHRARVITLGSTANNANAMAANQQQQQIDLGPGQTSSLLNGSYLKFRIQQLTGQVHGISNKLKQSNSDNFLDQLGQQQDQPLSAQIGPRQSIAIPEVANSRALCGTLPKNRPAPNLRAMAGQSGGITFFSQHRPSSSFSGHHHHHQNQVQMRNFESPYGQLRTAGIVTPDTGTYSATGAGGDGGPIGGVQHSSSAALTSLVLAAAPGSCSSKGTGRLAYPDNTGHQQPPLGDRRVEQLVISGKQYIHQTSANRPLYDHQHQQRQQSSGGLHGLQSQQQQTRHLQLTAGNCAPYGSLQRINNLHATTSRGGAVGQPYGQQQLDGEPIDDGRLVCMSHQQQPGCDQVTNELSSGVCVPAGNNSLEAQSFVVDIGGYRTSSVDQQQHARVTSENYPPPIGIDSNSVINNNNNDAAACKTSDLGDELPPIECNENTNHQSANGGALCHVAHLTLIREPAGGGVNLDDGLGFNGGNTNMDSDGMSSGTQRSFANTLTTTTTGSPSSGIMEMDGHHHQHHQHHQLDTHNNNNTIYPKTPIVTTSSSSTIASCSDRGCNSSTNMEHESLSATAANATNGIPDARCMMAQASLRRPRTSSGIRQAKKSQLNCNKSTTTSISPTLTILHPRRRDSNLSSMREYVSDLLQEFDSRILDQCTMFVDGGNFHLTDGNNNLNQQQFYVLPADELGRYTASTKNRVRLVGINNDLSAPSDQSIIGMHQLAPDDQHQQVGNPNLASINQVNFPISCQQNGNSSCANDLHTDV